MAETRLEDVIVPSVFDRYVMERSLALNAFYTSGILVQNPVIYQNLAGGSKTFTIPFWKDLSGDSEVLTETSDMTVNNVTSDKMIVRRQLRGKSWGYNDLAAQLSGDDPAGAIADRVASYWASEKQKLLVCAMRGIIADNVANDSGDLVVDISTEDGDNATSANKISAEKTIDAIMKQGDRFKEMTALAVHSIVYTTLVKNDLIDYITDSASKVVIPTYLGMKVIVDDNLPVIAGSSSGYKYHSYLFKQGAIGYAENIGRFVASEVERKKAGIGIENLYTRSQFAFAPAGFSWVMSNDTATSPSNADLYAAASWDRVFNAKNTGIIALISNG